MKKEYVSPDFKAFKVTLDDIILQSTEETIPEIIGGDGNGDGNGDYGDDF